MNDVQVQLDPTKMYIPRCGFATLKFKIEDSALKRQFLMMLTGAVEVPTTPEQANALAEMEQFLRLSVGVPMEHGLEFGLMYLKHDPALIDVAKIHQVANFVDQHPELVEFDNLNPLRERLADYSENLSNFLACINRFRDILKPEQMNHPVRVPADPHTNGHIDSGG